VLERVLLGRFSVEIVCPGHLGSENSNGPREPQNCYRAVPPYFFVTSLPPFPNCQLLVFGRYTAYGEAYHEFRSANRAMIQRNKCDELQVTTPGHFLVKRRNGIQRGRLQDTDRCGIRTS
jgi:hypothetical protein